MKSCLQCSESRVDFRFRGALSFLWWGHLSALHACQHPAPSLDVLLIPKILGEQICPEVTLRGIGIMAVSAMFFYE